MVSRRSHTSAVTPRLRRALPVALTLLALLSGWSFAEPKPSPARSTAFDKDRHYLMRVKDFQPFSLGGLEPEDWDDKEPFEDLALHAAGFTEAELFAAARKDVSYGDMMAQNDLFREEVRFELVHIEGRMKRLKRMGTTARLREAGVPELYQAWIFPKGARDKSPLCVILTEPPAGVEPADDLTPGVPVVTAGYFFKIVEYSSGEPNPNDPTRTLFRRAPLLVGRSLAAEPRGAFDSSGLATNMVLVVLVCGGVILGGLLALSLWLRKTDGGTRRANALRRKNPYAAPPPDEPPAAPEPQP